jgi:hypothetical protein
MTRARALKHTIRARAAKTGERYTTARRHVLAQMKPVRGGGKPSGLPVAEGNPKGLPPPVKGAISDAAVIKKTGKDLAHWYNVLDRFGAVQKGHTAAARHLFEEHGVPGWYTQGITVSYERARGVRAVNQRCDGDFEVSASKVMTTDAKTFVKAFTDARQRAKWTKDVDAGLAKALTSGVSDKKSKGFVIRPDGMARFRYQWNDTTVQLYAYPKAGGKLNVTVQHTKLPDGDAVEPYRRQWKTALAALAAELTA